MSILRRLGKLKPSEKALLKELYQEYKPLLYKNTIKITKDEKAAEDIIHNTFIKVSDKIIEIDDPVQLKKWMMTVARNEAFDYYKKNKKTTPSEKIDVLNSNLSTDTIPEENIKRIIELESINELSSKYRDVVYYKVFENLTFREIAFILNKKEATLRSQYNRALGFLKKKFIQEGDSNE